MKRSDKLFTHLSVACVGGTGVVAMARQGDLDALDQRLTTVRPLRPRGERRQHVLQLVEQSSVDSIAALGADVTAEPTHRPMGILTGDAVRLAGVVA